MHPGLNATRMYPNASEMPECMRIHTGRNHTHSGQKPHATPPGTLTDAPPIRRAPSTAWTLGHLTKTTTGVPNMRGPDPAPEAVHAGLPASTIDLTSRPRQCPRTYYHGGRSSMVTLRSVSLQRGPPYEPHMYVFVSSRTYESRPPTVAQPYPGPHTAR